MWTCVWPSRYNTSTTKNNQLAVNNCKTKYFQLFISFDINYTSYFINKKIISDLTATFKWLNSQYLGSKIEIICIIRWIEYGTTRMISFLFFSRIENWISCLLLLTHSHNRCCQCIIFLILLQYLVFMPFFFNYRNWIVSLNAIKRHTS